MISVSETMDVDVAIQIGESESETTNFNGCHWTVILKPAIGLKDIVNATTGGIDESELESLALVCSETKEPWRKLALVPPPEPEVVPQLYKNDDKTMSSCLLAPILDPSIG